MAVEIKVYVASPNTDEALAYQVVVPDGWNHFMPPELVKIISTPGTTARVERRELPPAVPSFSGWGHG